MSVFKYFTTLLVYGLRLWRRPAQLVADFL